MVATLKSRGVVSFLGGECPPHHLNETLLGDTTVTRAGEHTVSIRTTGYNKGRFTVVLAAMAEGRKLKPFMAFRGVHIIPELSCVPGVVVALLSAFKNCLSSYCVRPTNGHLANIFVVNLAGFGDVTP